MGKEERENKVGKQRREKRGKIVGSGGRKSRLRATAMTVEERERVG